MTIKTGTLLNHIGAEYLCKMPYAAYGSNLNLDQMSDRCKLGSILSRGVLRGWRLHFAYHAGIQEREGSACPVGIYTLSPSDIRSLDRQEALGRAYDRVAVTAHKDDGTAVACFTYLKRNMRAAVPSPRYIAIIRTGYRHWGMDDKELDRAYDRAYRAVERRAEKEKAAAKELGQHTNGKHAEPQYDAALRRRMLKAQRRHPATIPAVPTKAQGTFASWTGRDTDKFVNGAEVWYKDFTGTWHRTVQQGRNS